jgi:hypothetical protein
MSFQGEQSLAGWLAVYLVGGLLDWITYGPRAHTEAYIPQPGVRANLAVRVAVHILIIIIIFICCRAGRRSFIKS